MVMGHYKGEKNTCPCRAKVNINDNIVSFKYRTTSSYKNVPQI